MPELRVIIVLPYSSLATSNGLKPNLFGDGYHVRLAKEIMKRSHKYQIECWRSERMLEQETRGEQGGIVYRAFPSWRPSLGRLTPFVYRKVVDLYAPLRWSLWREYSWSLLKALKEECAKGDTIVHLYQLHFDLSYLICLYLGGRVPIIGRHIGGTPYGYNLISYLSNLPLSLLERKALANVDVMLLGTEWHYQSFKKFYKDIPRIVYPMPECVDFDLFKPMDKLETKKLLGIAPDKKVVIHVGRFDKAKGFDTILDILPVLRRNYDVEFIAVGGTKQDMLYKRAVDSGVRVLEWLPQEELVRYYSASDVFLFPKFYDKEREADSEKFMGAGVACVEALGCGLPVVGTNLKGFFATPDELRGIGEIPSSRWRLLHCIMKVLDYPENYTRCREVAVKYYSWTPIVERLLGVFDEVSEKYYGR